MTKKEQQFREACLLKARDVLKRSPKDRRQALLRIGWTEKRLPSIMELDSKIRWWVLELLTQPSSYETPL